MHENNKTLHVFDADRTLIDTDKVFALLIDSLERHGFSTDELIDAERDARESGVSFNPLVYLTENTDDTQKSKLRIIQGLLLEVRDPERVRLDGVSELLETLRRDMQDFIIHTYGDNDWQMAKLQACSLDSIPCIITHSVPKARDIVTWQGDDRLYRPATQERIDAYTYMVVYDDKESNFVGLPEGVTAVHVVQEGERPLVKLGPLRYRAVGARGMLEYYRTVAK